MSPILACFLATTGRILAADTPAVIAPKVVVLTMFEVGKDGGDVPGEFQYWGERFGLTRHLPLPAAQSDVRLNEDGSVVSIITGMGNTRSAASVMALGLDPRFDFRRSYWLVAGIAGIDPADGSLGSAAWAEYVVEGDLAHEIDAREIPGDWETGFIPLRRSTPYQKPLPDDAKGGGHVFHLNPALVEWAYQLTRSVPLADNASLAKRRAAFVGFPNAQRPPFVLKGDNLASSTFWHGERLNQWANRWVDYYTEGKGNYVTTAMEDTGTLQALSWLTRAGKADVGRALVLRTASNFDRQPPGMTAAESLAAEHADGLSGFLPSLEAAYQVGSTVVRELVNHWDRFETRPPGGE